MGNKTRPKSTRTAIIRIPARGLQFAEFFQLEPVGKESKRHGTRNPGS
jgi:hypothetical protein